MIGNNMVHVNGIGSREQMKLLVTAIFVEILK